MIFLNGSTLARYNTNKEEDMKPLILIVGPCAYKSTEQMEQVFRGVQKKLNRQYQRMMF